jgi:hypothetical protein
MTTEKAARPDWVPERIPEDVVVSEIDLDEEVFISGGRRLTSARAEQLADQAERHAGRPSLTAPGEHSPSLNMRVPRRTKERLEAVAYAQRRRPSEVVREALEEYLATQP